MKTKYLILVAIFSLIWAEDMLTLDSALSYAQEHSPKAQMIKRDHEINRARAYEGYGAILPNLGVNYSDNISKTPDNPSAALYGMSSEQRSKTTGFTASQLLFSFSGLAAFKASNAALDLAEYSYQDAQQNFDLEVKKAYYDLSSAANLNTLMQKIYTQAQRHAREVEIMNENGLVSRKELLDAKVRALQAKQDMLNTEKTYALVLSSFNTLVGKPRNFIVGIPTTNITIPADLLTKTFDLAELTQYAEQHKPAFRSFDQTVLLAESDDLNALGESLPSAYYNYSKNNTQYDKESPFTVNGETEYKTVSAGWKFFAGGANLHKMNEKKNYKEKIYAQKTIMLDMLAADIENSILELQLKASAYLAAKEQGSLAQESYKLAEDSFRNGAGTSTQVNDALAQLTAAENNLIKSMYDYEYAREKLNYAVGKEII